MTGPRIRLMDRATIDVDGQAVVLKPYTAAVLIRLILAGGTPVSGDQLTRDIWPDTVGRPDRRDLLHRHRVPLQQRISELRRHLDPDEPGEASTVLQTIRGRSTSYRLMLDPADVDVLEFRRLVTAAHGADTAQAIVLLRAALDLWRGRPLLDAEGFAFAGSATAELLALQLEAHRELRCAYVAMGRTDMALALGDELAAQRPQDAELLSEIRSLRESARRPAGMIRYTVGNPPTPVVIGVGDLFDHDDAHLVVGFTDTFDTLIDDDRIISSRSVQGQFQRRYYDGDRATLDAELAQALRGATRVGTESRSAKPLGKRVRFEMGTVAVLRQPHRRIFAVAYSRMGNELVSRSTQDDLRKALDGLWESIARHGLLGTVAMPLVGASLARLEIPAGPQAKKTFLLQTIIESFRSRTARGEICRELRIVLRQPPDLDWRPSDR